MQNFILNHLRTEDPFSLHLKLINDRVGLARSRIFLFFTCNGQLIVFSSHITVFNYVKLVKRMRKKISNYHYFLIALEILIFAFNCVLLLAFLITFLIQVIHLSQVWRVFILDWEKHSCFTPKCQIS